MSDRELSVMLAILAAVAFLVAAILVFLAAISPAAVVGIIALGLFFLALHDLYPWAPWRRG